MLSKAKAQMPMLYTLAAEAAELPFRQSIFDVVTASFVMSHLQDYRAGLIEAYRVLKPAGVFAMTSWAAGTNPYSKAWDRLLSEAVPKKRLQDGVNQVTPFASYFEDEKNVKVALIEAGFADIEFRMVALKCRLSLEDYLADREITSAGRYAKHILGPDIWSQLVANAREKLRQKFGSCFNYNRGAIIALGHKK
jgi:SAM-dependent methyltransferase